jgi:chromate transporter
MAIHLGLRRAGWRGLLVAGTCFIGPAMLIVLALAALYVHFGSAPETLWVLYGVKPVVIAIIAQALAGLSRKAVKGRLTLAAGVLALAAAVLDLNPLAVLFATGLAVMLVANAGRLRSRALGLFALPFAPAAFGATAPMPFGLLPLFLTFLKIGSVLYGSGYVLLAFLRADLVLRFGWLTDQQLLDAVAIGQVTPGPLFTTATFIGYVLGGTPGALLATLGIFLPSFLFVALSSRFIPRMRRSPWLGSLLDGVNVASLALMAAVTWQLGRASLVDPWTIAVALLSLLLLVRWRVNTTWLIAGGALVGVASHVLGGA